MKEGVLSEHCRCRRGAGGVCECVDKVESDGKANEWVSDLRINNRPSSSLQAGHEAKAIDRSAEYRHDPMDFGGGRPSIPAVQVVNVCQTLSIKVKGRTRGRQG